MAYKTDDSGIEMLTCAELYQYTGHWMHKIVSRIGRLRNFSPQYLSRVWFNYLLVAVGGVERSRWAVGGVAHSRWAVGGVALSRSRRSLSCEAAWWNCKVDDAVNSSTIIIILTITQHISIKYTKWWLNNVNNAFVPDILIGCFGWFVEKWISWRWISEKPETQ